MGRVSTFWAAGGEEGADEFAASWVDRLNAITKPLLERLAKNLDRPQIIYPDLIEISSGFWDLRKYTEGPYSPLSLAPPPTHSACRRGLCRQRLPLPSLPRGIRHPLHEPLPRARGDVGARSAQSDQSDCA